MEQLKISDDKYVNLIDFLEKDLIKIDNPSQYFPSEYIYGGKEYKNDMIKCAVCFPDLYEIGMANSAIKIIFDILNRYNDVFCDRVFSVKPDYENLLKEKEISLYTLKEHFLVNKLDFLGVAISYELSCTNLLQILNMSKISLRADKRKETDPLIILGGPAITNPLPFSPFSDFVHIGEAEDDFHELIEILKKYKNRTERIKEIKKLPHFWYKGKEKTTRAIDITFGTENEDPIFKHYVVPSFNISQDHGTVEIMRGCPNNCRFCHAGQYYKPYRQRSIPVIEKLVKQCIQDFGYKEVTLSSLSSGDYPNLDLLIKKLNNTFKTSYISFSLPSLKVSSFSLNILEQISEVRKSGLTFAIETPLIEDQKSLNKNVPIENIINILNEAKARGWRSAKFYFMIGLPYTDQDNEEKNITSYITEIYKETKMNLHVNIGTFIPKPHTAFQWAKQLNIIDAREKLKSIKNSLIRSIPSIKVSYHEPLISYLEGLYSRGDEKLADVSEYIFNKGERLTAWDEYLNYQIWEEAIEKFDLNNYKFNYSMEEKLPWSNITLNISNKYLKDENTKAEKKELTPICDNICTTKCGVCNNKTKINKTKNIVDNKTHSTIINPEEKYKQVVFVYEKKGRAIFNSHISVVRQFEMAFQRANVPVLFTKGFNPKPKLEFANPLAIGIVGENEVLLCELPENFMDKYTSTEICSNINNKLAEGYTVKNIHKVKENSTGKKISLATNILYSLYEIKNIKDEILINHLNNESIKNKKNIFVKDDIYTIKTNGEENIFKKYFTDSYSKFDIISSCQISRKNIIFNESVF